MPARAKPEPPAFIVRLGAVMPVEWRAMFGGYGIYSEGVFFALVSSQGVAYLRVGEGNRADYEKAGSEPFMPYSRVKSRAGARIVMPYSEVPGKVQARPATLRAWAEKALEEAKAARVKKKTAREEGAGEQGKGGESGEALAARQVKRSSAPRSPLTRSRPEMRGLPSH